MLRPEKYTENEEEEILYSDEEPHQSDSCSGEESEEWDIDWDELECVDEYGEDRHKDLIKKTSHEASSDEELGDLELDDAEDEETRSKNEAKEREGRQGTREDHKKESDEEEGDPWSQWVGRGDGLEKEKREGKDESRGEEKRKEYRREEKKPTLAELVLKGMVSEGQATRDKKSRAVRRSPPRREERRREISPLRRKRSRSPRRRDSPSRRIHRSPPSRKEMRSPLREGRRLSPSMDRRRERSPRRRNPSPVRKERIPSPPRREKKGRSPERQREAHSIRTTSPSRGVALRRERYPLPPKISLLPRLSSPNRTVLRRSRSPMGATSLRKMSSPNRVMIGERAVMRKERSPIRNEKEIVRSRSPILIPRKDLPSLLDVKIVPCIPSRMEGRVKREEKEEERRQERIVRDEKEEKKEKKEENKEERKRHVPIVWNDKETDAKKIHRSIGHVDGIVTMERMEGVEKKEEKKRVEKIGGAFIPLSMVERVGRCPIQASASTRSILVHPKSAMEIKKSLDPPSHTVISPMETLMNKCTDSILPLPQPTELVRIITNNDSITRKAEHPKEKKNGVEIVNEKGEAREMEVEEDDDEGGWLSTSLQTGDKGIPTESTHRIGKKGLNPSSAALRLFGRARASAVSSSTLKDAKPLIKEVVRDARDSLEEKTVGIRTKKGNRLKMEERIDMSSSTDIHGKTRRRRKNIVGSAEKVSHSNRLRLLEAYY